MPNTPTEEETHTPAVNAEISTQAQQSWGAVIAIVVILAMVVIGAMYAWDNRISKETGVTVPTTSTTTAR